MSEPASELVYWVRLQEDEDSLYFLQDRSGLLFSAWVKLVKYAKVHSRNRGQIKFSSIKDLAYVLRIRKDEVWALEELLVEAQKCDPDDPESGPAVSIVGKALTILVWHRYQSPEAKRVRQHRERQRDDESNGQTDVVTDDPQQAVTDSKSPLQIKGVTDASHARTRARGRGKEQEIKGSSVVSTGGMGGETDHQPTDRIEKIFRDNVVKVPKFQAIRLDLDVLRDVIARARREAPSDQAIIDQIGVWQLENSNGKFKDIGSDPVVAFSKWIDQQALAWRKQRLAGRESDSKPKEGRDYVFVCRGDENVARRVIPGTDCLFDEEKWKAEQGVYAQ